MIFMCLFFFSSRRRHTRCALVTGVQTCALPICIAISLGWNWFNQRQTIKTAKSLRVEQYRSAQWTRVRSKIEQAVDGLVDAGFVVQKQAQTMDSKKPENTSIDLLNLTIVQAQDQLASALDEAECSAYCDGNERSEEQRVGEECVR